MTNNAPAWVDTKTPLAANATFTGTSRLCAALGSGTSGASYFGAMFYADQAGTCYVDASDDGVTWIAVSTLALTAGSVNDLKVPLRTAYYRVRFVNGGTIQGAFSVFSNLTQA